MEKSSNPNQPIISWQHPFVDIFKKFNVFDSSTKAKKGTVTEGQDISIGRRVIKLQGAISATNYVIIPDPETGAKSLHLTGRYIYLEILPVQGKFFNIHLDFNMKERDTLTRFSISNMYDQYKVVGGSCLQIPYPSDAPLKWTVMVLDVNYHLENFGLFEHTDILDFNNLHELRTVQICSTLSFRGIYTSDICYTAKNLPKELDFKPPKDKKWSGHYQIVYYPKDIDPEEHPLFKSIEAINNENQPESSNREPGDMPSALASVDPNLRQTQKSFQSSVSQRYEQSQQLPPLEELVPPLSQKINQQQALSNSAMNTSQKQYNPENLVKRSQIVKKSASQIEAQGELKPYPICLLNHTMGYSGNNCPTIKWSKHLERQNELIYSSGSILISSEVGSSKQRFFQGHSKSISCFDVSKDGRWIVSAQEGDESQIRIWDYVSEDCISEFIGPHNHCKNISISYNKKFLATVGLDRQKREVIAIWNLEDLALKKIVVLVTKQISDFNVISLKFSPVDEEQLVSCGKENIRFWRIKDDYLRGSPVVLNSQARNSIFTVLDFEFVYDEASAALQSAQIRNVFVGSKQGYIFQIDYATKKKLNVYFCHEGPITSICLSAGVCVTGSQDLYLRVWPIDLRESWLELKHEAVIISVDISADALKVAFGTSNGALTILDMTNNKHDTLLRSHTDEIIEMHIHSFSNYLVSLSQDFTIRLWDLEKYEQVYEFSFPIEEQCTTISCCNNSNTFAAGYSTGIFRIFDIDKTCSILEGRYHEKGISHIIYSPDSKHLVVADQNSFYCLYDVVRNYQPVKIFEREIPSNFQNSAFSPDSEILAMIGDSGSHINIVDTYTLGNILKIFSSNTSFSKLTWANNNTELFALTDNCKVKVFGIDRADPLHNEAYLLREVSCTHLNSIQGISLTNNFKYIASVGADNLLKIWDYELALTGPNSNQVFLGHVNKINCICFTPDNSKILTAGGFEGIYEWNFLGDLSRSERAVDFSEYAPVNVKKLPLSTSSYQNHPVKRVQHASQQQPLTFEEGEELQKDYEESDIQQFANMEQQRLTDNHNMPFRIDRVINDINDIQQNMILQVPLFEVSNSEQSHPIRHYQDKENRNNQNNPIEILQDDSDAEDVEPIAQLMAQQKNIMGNYQNSKKSNSALAAAANAPRFVQIKEEPVKPEVIEYHKQKKKRDKRPNAFRYASDKIRKENNLPFRHYYLPNTRTEQIEDKNLKLRDNKEEFQTECLVSFNNNTHDNVVWNYLQGWFAYSSENIVIIETLSKIRNQKLINLPDYISCMNLSKDFKFLVVGSASYNQKDISSIYVIDCKTYEIVKTLSFHTRGVQSISFSANKKYIVSIGNCKECTLAIWEWPSGKLLTTSYTLDRINDLKISEILHSSDNILEFCTVGRDTLQFWALDKQETLRYYDIFVPKQEFPGQKNSQGISEPVFKAPEVTAVDYIQFGNKQFAIAGLSTGEIILVDNESFEIVYRSQVALNDQQILDVKVSNQIHRVIVTSMDEHIHYWDFEKNLLEGMPFTTSNFFISWVRMKLGSSATSFFLDPTFKEGLVGLYNGGIHYVSLENKYKTVLSGSINCRNSYDTYLLTDKLLATASSDGNLKLWNVQTGEEVMEYKFQSAITAMIFEQKTSKILCFFANNNDIKIINSQKFYQAETYMIDEIKPSDKTSTDYPIRAFEAVIGGRSSKFLVMKGGNIYTLEQLMKDKSPLLRLQKIFRVENISEFIPNSQKSIFVSADTKGKVKIYTVDYESDRSNPYSFLLTDECDYLENPYSSLLDASQDQLQNQKTVQSEAASQTRIILSSTNENTYYAIIGRLQYAFVRNFQKRQILQRINLHDFPISISLIETKKASRILVGLQNGSMEKINVEEKEERELYTGVLEGPITSIIAIRTNNPQTNVIIDKVITSSKDGLTFYTIG